MIKTKTGIKLMSFEEVVEQYEVYLWKEAHKYKDYWQFEGIDDVYQVALIGCWKGYRGYKYNKEKPVLFLTYMSRCVQNSIFMKIRDTKKRDEISFNTKISIGDNDQERTLEDTLEANFDISSWINVNVINKYISKLSPKEKEFVLAYLGVISVCQYELAKKYNTGQPSVSRKTRELMNSLKKQLLKEGVDY